MQKSTQSDRINVGNDEPAANLESNVEKQSTPRPAFDVVTGYIMATHFHNAQRLGCCRQRLHAQRRQTVLQSQQKHVCFLLDVASVIR